MLDSLTLLRAMNGIHGEDVVIAGKSYFDSESGNPEEYQSELSSGKTDDLLYVPGGGKAEAFSEELHLQQDAQGLFHMDMSESQE